MGSGIAALAGIIPQYALGSGLMNMSFMPILGFFDNTVYSPLDGNIAGDSLVYMAVSGAIYSVLVLVLERYDRCTRIPLIYKSALQTGVEWGHTTSHPPQSGVPKSCFFVP